MSYVKNSSQQESKHHRRKEERWCVRRNAELRLAVIVTEEGGPAHTINPCKQCYNERRLNQGE